MQRFWVFLLVVAGGCSEAQPHKSVGLVSAAPEAKSLSTEAQTVVSGNVVFQGQPRSIDVLLLPFKGASVKAAEDRSRADRAGLYLLSTETVDSSKSFVCVVPKDGGVSASECIVSLEDVPGGPRKGRAEFLRLYDDPDRSGESFDGPPLGAEEAAERIARLSWAEDQRIQAGVIQRETAEKRLGRSAASILLRVPQLQDAGTKKLILEKAELKRAKLRRGPRRRSSGRAR
ncbi:MAG: hypothetical protein AAF581_19875, partial [Planctomycetota bacterium]